MIELPDECSAEEAVIVLTSFAPTVGIVTAVPSTETLRRWHRKQQLTVGGRNFTRRNLLEILAILKLRQGGMTQQSAVERVLALDNERLEALVLASPPRGMVVADDEPFITLHLLAKGILEQHRWVTRGAIVGHSDARKTGMDNTPISLQQAMARLGRHYFEDGVEDRTASVHTLLRLCTTPLHEWAPRALAQLPDDRSAVLVDPVYLVPSEDCGMIAQGAEGSDLSDLIEHYLHEELRSTLKKLGDDADAAYTIIREFIGRHPLATDQDLMLLNANVELNLEAIHFVEGLYRAVHAARAKHSLVRRCAYCQGLIGDDNLCSLAGCRDDHPQVCEATPVRLDQAYVARPEVLKYWVDPAREELRLYDALRSVKRLTALVKLYPHSDRCDIAIGEDIGVDVKDYRDPVRLAQRLNRSLGGLGYYPTRVLAIADRRWSNVYRDRLIEQFTADNKRTVQVMSVTQSIHHLKHYYPGGV